MAIMVWTGLLCSIALLANTIGAFVLPDPAGKYNVTLSTGPLTDHSRGDRELMLSIFQPATCEKTIDVPYMPKKTAKYQGPFLQQVFNLTQNFSPIFLDAKLQVCASDSNNACNDDDFPILLFQPGYSIPRLYYSYLASTIASEGYTVVTIDNPEDCNIITYPDGHTVINTNLSQTDAAFVAALPGRIADLSFVIDQITTNGTAVASLLPNRGSRTFPDSKIATFGHSEGGVAAVLAAQNDTRIKGAINWDGSFLVEPSASGINKPILLMSHGFADETWDDAVPLLTGPTLWVNIANTTHETFSDIPTLLDSAGLGTDGLGPLIGTIKPTQMVEILRTYSTQWMKGVFKGEIGGGVLDKEKPKKFPQIDVVVKKGF